jgi:hypothetical protein
MSLNRFAKRRDANEPELLKVLRQFGALWVQAPPLDGWCCFRERWTPVEIKLPDGPQGGRKDRHYTEAQILFLACCREHNAPVWTWRSERDVFESLGARQTA